MADRPALVLLHAWPLNSLMWRDQVEVLGSDGAVLALDLPGFGSEPAAPADLDAWARGISAKLRAQGIEKAVVAGCSMGGYVGLAIMRVDPGLLAGLALVSARAIADTAIVATARRAMVDRIEHSSGNTEFVEEDALLLLSHATRRDKPVVVAAVREMAAQGKPAALAAAYRAIGGRPDMRDAVVASTVPLALIAGADDPLMTIGEARKLAEIAPRAKFTEVPDAGHFSPLENPDVVTPALREFWASVS